MRLLSTSDRFVPNEPGVYNNVYLYTGASETSNHELSVVNGGSKKQLYLEDNSCYTCTLTCNLSGGTDASGYSHGGTYLVIINTNSQGVPTITYTSPVVGSFGGVFLSTVLDSRLGRYRVKLDCFGWGVPITYGVAKLEVLECTRS